MTYVKICGMTNIEDARVAAEAGADFLGFIFYAKSPRYVTPEQAGKIARGIRAEFGKQAPRFAGVFVSEPVDAVRAAINVAGLDLVQLHGTETPDEVAALSPHSFKALRPQTLAEAQTTFKMYFPIPSRLPSTAAALSLEPLCLPAKPDLLVDAYHPHKMGGTGHVADLEIARWLAKRCNLLLAGGLTPDNVGDAIAKVRPWGVDVSSGVELTKGKKDHAKLKTFIENAKNSVSRG